MKIELPDINIPQIVNQVSQSIYRDSIGGIGVLQVEANGMGLSGKLISRMEIAINNVHHQDRCAVIVSIIQMLDKDKRSLYPHLEKSAKKWSIEATLEFIDHMIYSLYNMLYDLGIDVRKDIFSVDELDSIITELDDIVIALSDNITNNEQSREAVNAVINDVEQLKKAAYLGRSKFKEKFIIFCIEFAGTKVLDTVWPKIVDVLRNIAARLYPTIEPFINKALSE